MLFQMVELDILGGTTRSWRSRITAVLLQKGFSSQRRCTERRGCKELFLEEVTSRKKTEQLKLKGSVSARTIGSKVTLTYSGWYRKDGILAGEKQVTGRGPQEEQGKERVGGSGVQLGGEPPRGS